MTIEKGLITTLKRMTALSGGEFYCIYNSKNDLIATAHRQKEKDWFKVCINGGKHHGKITMATDFENLNEKSVEIERTYNM